MKKQLILICALSMLTLATSAQKVYKLAKNSGKLSLNISGAIVEGYNGSEIIFTIPKSDGDHTDERAKGLMPMNSSGFKDNTGIGLDIAVKGDEIIVNPVSVSNQAMVSIKLPQNIKLSFVNNNITYQDTLTVKNIKTEIDVSVTGNDVILVNNVGPMNIKTLHGSVDATFSGEIKGPISIVSVHGHVDVALPVAVKANLDVVSNYGKIYAAEGLKIAVNPVVRTERAPAGTSISIATSGAKKGSPLTMTLNASPAASPNTISTVTSAAGFSTRRDSETLNGKINGGGIDILLKSNSDNVYIRQK